MLSDLSENTTFARSPSIDVIVASSKVFDPQYASTRSPTLGLNSVAAGAAEDVAEDFAANPPQEASSSAGARRIIMCFIERSPLLHSEIGSSAGGGCLAAL